MVRLKGEANLALSRLEKFQFHYGTIKRLSLSYNRFNTSNFNSTMVRLKVSTPFLFTANHANFNSTMVRLKVKQTSRQRLFP